MRYITLLSTLLFTVFIHAQAPRGFYLSAGVNNTTLNSDDLLADSAMGYKIGTNFNFGYHESYNYQIEVMYNYARLDLLAVDANYLQVGNTKASLSTIDVGAFFNYYIIKPDEDKFFLGPQAGVNFSFGNGQLVVENSSDNSYLPYRLNPNELQLFPKVSYGGALGLTGGYNDFRFDIRYVHGFTNILLDAKTDSYDEFNRYTGPDLEGKLSTISFTVSYRLNKLFGGE